MLNSVTIFGVGLIGGSLARAIRQAGFCQHVTGCSRNEEHLKKAISLGVIDSYELQAEDAVKNADMVILSTPLRAMPDLLSRIKPALSESTILTDVGSAKASVIEAVEKAFGELPASFVPGHPIAGTEKSGVDASFSELFQNRQVILTPTGNSAENAIRVVTELWEATGANVTLMDAHLHDEVLAATSHLPHILSFSLVDVLAGLKEHDDIFKFAAGGFRDFSRIASSDPVMWRDICLSNQQAIIKMLDFYLSDLNKLKDEIASSDGDALLKAFTRAKTARDTFIET